MFPGNTPQRIAELVSQLRQVLASHQLDYELWEGAEVRLAEDTLQWFRRVGVPTLGPSRCVLVDHWGHDWPAYAQGVIDHLLQEDYQPILAHPERMCLEPETWEPLIDRLLDQGVWLQGNFNSFAGGEGQRAVRWLEQLLASGQIRVMALDMHRPHSLVGRLTGLAEFAQQFGQERLTTMIAEQPRAILAHQASPSPAGISPSP